MTVWVLNTFLYLAYFFNPPMYQAMVQNGARMFNCEELTPAGYVPSTACTDTMPVLGLEGM